MLEGSTFLSLGTLACLVLVFKIIMTWVHSLIACWLFLFPTVYSKVTYENPVVGVIGEDVVFQFNSTQPMHWAYWGTIRNNSKWLSLILIRKDANKPPKLHDDLTLFTYNGRVSFVGNLTAGHAWFQLRNLTLDDSNYYGARLRLEGQRQQLYSTFLKVQVLPNFTSPPPTTKYIVEGQQLQLLCSAVGPPTPDVTWVRVQGDSMVTISHGAGNALLNITNITREQTGSYECQAVNYRNQRPVTTQTSIYVMYKPSVVYLKSDTEVPSSPGDSITLRCMVNGFPYPNVTWYNPNEEPIIDNVTSSFGLSLISLDIKDAKDYGKYKCRAENILGYSEKHIAVVAYVGPYFTTPPPSSKNIAEGKHLQLFCSATGLLTPNVTWVRVQGNSKVTISHGIGYALLNITNITREQTGIYECQAENNPNQKPVTTQTSIHVLYKPSIVYLKSNTKVPSSPDDSITLFCMVNGFPYPNVTWYKPNEEPIIDNVKSSFGWSLISLDIKDAKDYGKYKCRVENILGYSEQYITVETSDDHNQQPKINYGKNPFFIPFIILIIIAGVFVVIAIVVFVIKKCYPACRTNRMSFDNVHEMQNLNGDKGQG